MFTRVASAVVFILALVSGARATTAWSPLQASVLPVASTSLPNTPLTSMNIGGGGLVSGLNAPAVNGSVSGVKWERTDAGGGYQWDSTLGVWTQIRTTSTFQPPFFGLNPSTNGGSGQTYTGSGGVQELRGCPASASVAYIYYWGYVFVSTNVNPSNATALTWTQVGNLAQQEDSSNSGYREAGPFMAVDPYNCNHVIYGTNAFGQGLYETFNGESGTSATWRQIPYSTIPFAVPFVNSVFNFANGGDGASGSAYRIVFDSTGGTTTCAVGGGTCAKNVYIWTSGSTTNATFTGVLSSPQSTSITGSISGTTLNVTAATGTIQINVPVSGSSITSNTVITAQTGGTTGGVGTYTVSISQSVGSESLSQSYSNLTVSSVSGTINVGDILAGANVGWNNTANGPVKIASGSSTAWVVSTTYSSGIASEPMSTQQTTVDMGLYASTNGETSFSRISGSGLTGPANIWGLYISDATTANGGGNIWLSDWGAGGNGNAWEYVPGSGWTEWETNCCVAVAINPADGKIALQGGNNQLLVSTSGSSPSFTGPYTYTLNVTDAPWQGLLNLQGAGSMYTGGHIIFDPNLSDQLISGGGQGTWTTPLPSSTFVWTLISSHTEELLVTGSLQVGSARKPSFGAQDEAGCTLDATSSLNAQNCFNIALLALLPYASGLSIAPGTSDMFAKVTGQDFGPTTDISSYSTDGFINSLIPFNTWIANPTSGNFTNDGSGHFEISGLNTTGLTTWSLGSGSQLCLMYYSVTVKANNSNVGCFGATVVNGTTVILQGSAFAAVPSSGVTFVLYAPGQPYDDWAGEFSVVNVTDSTTTPGLVHITTESSTTAYNGARDCVSNVVMTTTTVVNGCWLIVNANGGPGFDLANSVWVSGDSYVKNGTAATTIAPGGSIAASTPQNFMVYGGDSSYPVCTNNGGQTWSAFRFTGDTLYESGSNGIYTVTVTGGPYGPGSTAIGYSNSPATLQDTFHYLIPLTSGRMLNSTGSASPSTSTTGTINLNVPVPPGDSIANGASIGSSTGWPYAAYIVGKRIAADQVTPNTFYAMSENAGLIKWTNCNSPVIVAPAAWNSSFLQFGQYNSYLKAVPGQAGHLFWAVGSVGSGGPASTRLWRTCDGVNNTANSVTMNQVPGFYNPLAFGFGAAAPGQSYPAIYVIGWYSPTDSQANAQFGVWRSINDANNGSTSSTCATGNAWVNLISTPWINQGYGDIEGDPFIFGPVYGVGNPPWQIIQNDLLKRDLDPASNDNSPAFSAKTG